MQDRVVEGIISQDNKTKQQNKTQAALNYSTLLCKICWCKDQLNLYLVLRNFFFAIAKMILRQKTCKEQENATEMT